MVLVKTFLIYFIPTFSFTCETLQLHIEIKEADGLHLETIQS